jgi:gas vesicle protein
MGEPNQIIPQIIAGILTGGAGATTTLLGVFRKTKERLKALEELVGQDGSEGPLRTGIFLSIQALEETTKKLKREIESWEDTPPKWAERLLGRARLSSSSDLTGQVQFEESIQRSLRSFNERLSRAEEDLEKDMRRVQEDIERQLSEDNGSRLITREEYLRDSRTRAEEMLKLREQLATVNGMLRGVMTALGIIDPVTGKPSSPSIPIVRPPKLPPRPGR